MLVWKKSGAPALCAYKPMLVGGNIGIVVRECVLGCLLRALAQQKLTAHTAAALLPPRNR
jgi:hypothetical protein